MFNDAKKKKKTRVGEIPLKKKKKSFRPGFSGVQGGVNGFGQDSLIKKNGIFSPPLT